MKLINKIQITLLKREKRLYEGKARLLGLVIKNMEKKK